MHHRRHACLNLTEYETRYVNAINTVEHGVVHYARHLYYPSLMTALYKTPAEFLAGDIIEAWKYMGSMTTLIVPESKRQPSTDTRVLITIVSARVSGDVTCIFTVEFGEVYSWSSDSFRIMQVRSCDCACTTPGE